MTINNSPRMVLLPELPAGLAKLMLTEHNPSWAALSSPYRSLPHHHKPAFRHPPFSSWIELENSD